MFGSHAGDLELVQRTLRGIAAHSSDDGAAGFGKHSECIRLRRTLWESPDLTTAEVKCIAEFDPAASLLPTAEDAFEQLTALEKMSVEKPMPFTGATMPSVSFFLI